MGPPSGCDSRMEAMKAFDQAEGARPKGAVGNSWMWLQRRAFAIIAGAESWVDTGTTCQQQHEAGSRAAAQPTGVGQPTPADGGVIECCNRHEHLFARPPILDLADPRSARRRNVTECAMAWQCTRSSPCRNT